MASTHDAVSTDLGGFACLLSDGSVKGCLVNSKKMVAHPHKNTRAVALTFVHGASDLYANLHRETKEIS